MPNLFDMPIQKLQEIAKGEKPSQVRDKLNAPIDAMNRIISGVKPPQQVNPDSRTQVKLIGRSFEVLEVFGDYILTTDGFRIAKPVTLRQSWTDQYTDVFGVFYEWITSQVRTASRDDNPDDPDAEPTEEDQITDPPYSVGDIIFAKKGYSGGTGVLDDDGFDLEWIDENLDARQFVKVKGTLMIEDGLIIIDDNVFAIEF